MRTIKNGRCADCPVGLPEVLMRAIKMMDEGNYFGAQLLLTDTLIDMNYLYIGNDLWINARECGKKPINQGIMENANKP